MVTRSNVITVATDPEEGERFPQPIRDMIARFLERFKEGR